MNGETHHLTIEYPGDLLWALQQNPDELAANARLTLALAWYANGKLTSGLAAKLAGVPRSTFYFLLSQHGLSPFGQEPDELETDLVYARTGSSSNTSSISRGSPGW